MNIAPEISIIVPVYKVESSLMACLNSIEAQTSKALELILVDDGSPDRCGKMCDDFAAGKSYVKVIHKKNGGLSDARNVGIRNASGKYCMFLDSDDSIVPDACSTIMNYLQQASIDILYADCTWITESSRRAFGKRGFEILSSIPGATALQKELSDGSYAAMAPLGIYKREFLMKNQLFFKNGIYHEDEEWSPKVMMAAEKVMRIEFAFYNYNMRQGSITHSLNPKRFSDMLEIIDEYREIYSKTTDGRLKKYGMQYLSKLYMTCMANLLVLGERRPIDRKFVLDNLVDFREQLKGAVFVCSPRFYLFLMGLKNDSK